MSFGFYVRVLVLSLLTLGQHAEALSYRSGGSSDVKPFFGYPRSLRPGGFLGGSGSSYSGGVSSENLKPAAAGRSSGSKGRQVDGERQKPQQPRQTDPDTDGVLQTKAGMWDILDLLPTGNGFESSIASSYGIEMHSGPQLQLDSAWPAKPQLHSYRPKPKQPGYQSKPQQSGHQTEPQQSGYSSNSQQLDHKTRPWQTSYQPSYLFKPQQLGHQTDPQQTSYQPSYPSKPQQRGHQAKPQQPGYSFKPQQPSHQTSYQPSYPSKPQQPGQQTSYQPSYLAKPQKSDYQAKPQQLGWTRINFPRPPRPPPLLPPPPPPRLPQAGVTSGSSVQPTDSNPQKNLDPGSSRPLPMASPSHPRWRQQLVPVYSRPHRP